MKLENTPIAGAFLLQLERIRDLRGSFVKTFHQELFKEFQLEQYFTESYFSASKKNVIRGMHFQLPPHDHNKLVYVVSGVVIDVLLDLRKDSKTFRQAFSTELSSENNLAMYIPKGIAHGFSVVSEEAVMVYNTSTVYEKNADTGIRWDSFGFDWKVKNPIISERDNRLQELKNFTSPF